MRRKDVRPKAIWLVIGDRTIENDWYGTARHANRGAKRFAKECDEPKAKAYRYDLRGSDGSCLVYRSPCAEHGFIHGAEAEELRAGIEALLDEENSGGQMRRGLRHLLDKVDARDSLAYREALGKKGPRS